jgi:SAM-dependent methyltransferase
MKTTSGASVASVRDHYDRHLGPVYAWMAGGLDAAVERGATEVEALGLAPTGSGLAVDLGAGFGAHAIPLAHRGFEVLAIDGCAELLGALRARRGALPIDAVLDDLRSYRRHLRGRPELVLCMGDTLTHLPDETSVARLLGDVAADLESGGRLVITLRDYSTPLAGARRFVPVRSDTDRILTCFLEFEEFHVTVHDLLHERDGSEWKLRVSAYRKLRLAPERLVSLLRDNRLSVERSATASGMVRLVACPVS